MIYNTDFQVKYHDIKEELIKNKQSEENLDPECEYSNTDILLICDKLYRDELVSVFYADDIIDDKIDIGMRYISEKMMENNDFKCLANEIKQSYFMDADALSEAEQLYFTQNSNLMLILTLFKEEFFYILHKCICQQLTLGTIDNELLDELKKHTVDAFKS